jgi:hypothetical protein
VREFADSELHLHDRCWQTHHPRTRCHDGKSDIYRCGWQNVLPKAIREAANLGKGGSARIRLTPTGIIEIQALTVGNRWLKKVGKSFVAVSDGTARYDAVGLLLYSP